MRFSFVSLLAAGAAAQKFSFPLGNGFPDKISKASMEKIYEHAGGPLPNAPLPTKLLKSTQGAFQLVALQEIFEVAFFTQLLKNVEDEKPGFVTDDQDYVRRVLRRIRAQEELHALGANGILAGVGAKTVGGCTYHFPAKNFDTAIELAETFTAVVLGTVPALQGALVEDPQGAGLIPLLGSIVAQEGEQTGWFRAYQGKAPSAAPFLTGGAAQFAYSALRLFLDPGSCPLYPPVPYFPAITVLTPPVGAKNQVIEYQVEGTVDPDTMSMVYLSGQSLPFVVPITGVKKTGKITTFSAKFPFNSGFAKGLSLGAIAKGTKFADVTTLAEKTVYGPALILLQ